LETGSIEIGIEVDNLEQLAELFGTFDENAKVIEKETGASIISREHHIVIRGRQEDAELARIVVDKLLAMSRKREKIDISRIRYAVELAREGNADAIEEIMADVIAITSRGRQVKSRTIGQKRYVRAMKENTLTFAIGPAGTGKTYLAMAMAVMALKNKEVERIILTRPAVEAGENLGFLPGDLQTKVDPYLRPLYDALYEFLGGEAFQRLSERGVIEVAPLAYMRGARCPTRLSCWTRAQNCTEEQMKMFLTRFGENARIVVTGDITQIDLPKEKKKRAGAVHQHSGRNRGDLCGVSDGEGRGAPRTRTAHREGVRAVRENGQEVGMDGKRKTTRRQHISGLAIGAAALLAVYALIVVSITPVKYDFAVNGVAPETITASRTVVDTVSLQEAVDAAREAVAADPPENVYIVDEGIRERIFSNIGAFFDAMTDIPGMLRDLYINAQVAAGNGTYADNAISYDPAQVPWEKFLSDEQMQELRKTLDTPDMPSAAVYAVARMTKGDVEAMRETATEAVEYVFGALGDRIGEDNLSYALDSIQDRIGSQYSSGELLYLARLPVEKYLEAIYVIDESALQQAQDDAGAAVSPDEYQYIQGQTVVTKGDVVTAAEFAVLEALGVVGGQETDYLLYISILAYTVLLFVAYGIYLVQFERELIADTRHLLMLAAVTAVTAALAVPLARFDERIIPAFLGTMLACTLLSQRSALSYTVFLAFVVAPICMWSTGLFSAGAFTGVLASILGGSVCVFALHKPMHRTSLITAGLAAGFAGAAVAVLGEMIGAAVFTARSLAITGAYALGSGLLAGVLAIGTLPLWEAAFRASTPAKLLELSNPNHPLLKRLSLEAPGTYHHSILTANLAEAGADAVGASALLCRVGAYYHDVGKLKDPMYFAENQKGENPHDVMDPRESAKIITGHVTYGLDLARKYKLPREVLSIIAQHHGSTQVKFFAHKALEAGIEPKAAQFRYPGTKPATREAAIVMLADCVEAAVRSMDDPSLDQVREMIGRLIRERYNDGQLDDTPLNRQDLNHIAQAFAGVYESALHERVKYPGQE
jgi:putative nucleotidyltransferase with HDIG domain